MVYTLWGALKGNHFWGKQAGTEDPHRGLIFPGKRKGGAKRGNSGPLGRKLRSREARLAKQYANRKLRRLGKVQIGRVGRATQVLMAA